jgi:hypothetical protein
MFCEVVMLCCDSTALSASEMGKSQGLIGGWGLTEIHCTDYLHGPGVFGDVILLTAI